MTLAPSDESARVDGIRLFLTVASQRSSLLGGIKVALIVGTVVNLINQGEHLLGLHWSQVSLPKLLVTFCVPFCVSVYNATATRLRFDPGVRAAFSATLTCQKCHREHQVEKGALVPDCGHCASLGERTRWSPKEAASTNSSNS